MVDVVPAKESNMRVLSITLKVSKNGKSPLSRGQEWYIQNFCCTSHIVRFLSILYCPGLRIAFEWEGGWGGGGGKRAKLDHLEIEKGGYMVGIPRQVGR